jgi:hypothetical protein
MNMMEPDLLEPCFIAALAPYTIVKTSIAEPEPGLQPHHSLAGAGGASKS